MSWAARFAQAALFARMTIQACLYEPGQPGLRSQPTLLG